MSVATDDLDLESLEKIWGQEAAPQPHTEALGARAIGFSIEGPKFVQREGAYGRLSQQVGNAHGELTTPPQESHYTHPTSLEGHGPLIDRTTMREQVGVDAELTAIIDNQPTFSQPRTPRVALLNVAGNRADREGRIFLKSDDPNGPWVPEGSTHVAVLLDDDGHIFGEPRALSKDASLEVDLDMITTMAGEPEGTYQGAKETALKVNVDKDGKVTMTDSSRMTMWRPRVLIGDQIGKDKGLRFGTETVNSFMGYKLDYDLNPNAQGVTYIFPDRPKTTRTRRQRRRPQVDFDDLNEDESESSYAFTPNTGAPSTPAAETTHHAPYAEMVGDNGEAGTIANVTDAPVSARTGKIETEPEVREIEITPTMIVPADKVKKTDGSNQSK